MNDITLGQYELIYNAFSFTIAAMGAGTLFLWLNRSSVAPQYRTAVTVSGIVTAIALYHYLRITQSWTGSFTLGGDSIRSSGVRFNDAYRYVDWFLTVPLLLVELVLVMGLSRQETVKKSVRLAVLAAIMIALGYPGEISQNPGTRWFWWAAAMVPFLWIVYELFAGLKNSIANQPEDVRGLVNGARWLTVVSWSFYAVVFIFPMIGLQGGAATVGVQVGYAISDIVSKVGLGLLIYTIAVRKTAREGVATPIAVSA